MPYFLRSSANSERAGEFISAPTDTAPFDHEAHGNGRLERSMTCADTCNCRSCGCTCTNCCCRPSTNVTDSNQNVWPGQGSHVFTTQIDVNGLVVQMSNLSTNESSSSGSDSLDQRGSIDSSIRPPSFESFRRSQANENAEGLAEQNMQRYLNSIDENPFPHFLDRNEWPVQEEIDTSGMTFGDIDLNESMRMEPSNHNDRTSILSGYTAAFDQNSATASAVIRGAGTAFEAQCKLGQLHSFLSLTPECTHAR